jgi:DNA (cytosine-5)-methyltransferase 1
MNPLIVSLFSGAGGLSKGLWDSGLKPTLAVELDSDAVETYRKNISEDVLRADIATEADRIVAETERRIGCRAPFLVAGGPPCQGFSSAGARDQTDPRNRLVFSYLNIIDRLRPTWLLFENVEGILTSGDGDAVFGLIKRFTELGYTLRVEKVNFARWGVPQARKRVIIVGNNRGIPFDLPESTHSFDGKKHKGFRGRETTTLGEAVAGLPATPASDHRTPVSYATDEPASAFDGHMRMPPPGPRAHAIAPLDRELERITLLKPGQGLRDLPHELWPESYRSRAYRRVSDGMPVEKRGGAPAGIRRLDATHASLTITGFSPRELIHPILDRWLSLRECARLQTFPDHHDFHGSFQAVAQQIGNAVPPMAAAVLGRWLQEVDGQAGGDGGANGTAKPGLLGYHLTDALGMSPSLQNTDKRLRTLLQSPPPERELMAQSPGPGRPRGRPQNVVQQRQSGLFSRALTRLEADDKRLITRARTVKPIKLSDRELARLVSVLLHDLGHDDLIPSWVGVPNGASYYELPLSWFTQDAQREFTFGDFFLSCVERVQDFRVVFKCICALHGRRRKFDLILRNQPIPTMDQVAPRGLLEHGIVGVPGLTSWLMWRKWVFDVDNRSGQETGYLFEPMLAASLGGESYGSKKSPVYRGGDPSAGGRQVDCIVDADGEALAYEFKIRVTIAASGQGRWKEELSFPEDCMASGYKPVLMVMDPTPNDKLDELKMVFIKAGGVIYEGEAVWEHMRQQSGDEIAAFVKKYIREPILDIAANEERLLDLGLRYRVGSGGDRIVVSIGEHSWAIPRPPRTQAREIDDDEVVEVIPDSEEM